MKTRLLAALVFVAFLARTAAGSSVDEIVAAEMKDQNIPGCSVAVVQRGELAYAKGFGKANLELDAAASADTVYEIASLTKPLTAATVLTLVQEGALSFDSKLGGLIEPCPSDWTEITVRQLLNHTSGIKSYTSVNGFMQSSWRKRSPADLMQIFESLPLEFPPGEGWNYSNSGYIVLGIVLERKSGKSYGEVVRERLFQPLGMQATQFNEPRTVVPKRAAGYSLQDGKLVNRTHVDPSNAYAAGGLISTVVDLARWEAALHRGGLLSSQLADAMWSDPIHRKGMINGYGLGWYVAPGDGKLGKAVFHGGGIPGFASQMVRYPEHGLAVIVLANRNHAEVGSIAERVAKHWLELD